VPVGRATSDQRDVLIPLSSLRKHTTVFAGSGSGKTVLLRRIVEECALHGVSAIVLRLEQRSSPARGPVADTTRAVV
jgi:F0F1-type ATP synthase beta subunit